MTLHKYILAAFVPVFLFLIVACTTPATRQRMANLLEKAEAMNSNYTPMDTIKFMEEVHNFYMHHGNCDERIRANYMMGCVYRDRGDSPMALEYYLNAVNLADTTANDCDFKRLSRIYGQMALLFEQQRYPQKELEMWEQSISMAKKANDTIMILADLSRIGGAYYLWNDREKAIEYAKEAYNGYKKIKRVDLAAGTLPLLFDYYFYIDSLDKAKECLDEYIEKSTLVNGQSPLHIEGKMLYYFLGRYHEMSHKLDSATYFYRLLLDQPEDISNLEYGYKGLMSVYGKLHCSDSIVKYANLYADANDTANIRNSAKEVSRVQALYDYSQHQKTALEKTKENYALWMTVVIISILSGAIFLIVLVYVKRQKAIAFEKQKEANRNYATLIKNYAKVSRDFKRFKEDKAVFEKEKQTEIRNLQQTISKYQGNESDDIYDIEQSIIQNDIVRLFHKHASIAKRPTYKDWDNLKQTIEDLLPKFYSTMKSMVAKHNLSEKELKTIYLVRLYFSPSEIGVLLDLSSQNVTNIRSRLNKKLFGEKGTKTFVHNILHLIV